MNTQDGHIRNQSNAIWGYVEEVMSNQRLLLDIGFADRAHVKRVYLILIAGDLLHPELGAGYVSVEAESDPSKILRVIGERNRRVSRLAAEVVNALRRNDMACAERTAATPTKVIYICSNISETEQSLKSMMKQGLYRSSIVDVEVLSINDGVVFEFAEEYSYFEHDNSEMWM